MSSLNQTKSQTLKYTMYTQTLPSDMMDLFELSRLACITFDPQVFKIILELLRLSVAPTAIERMLKSMMLQHQKHHQGAGNASEMPTKRGRTHSGSSSKSRSSQR